MKPILSRAEVKVKRKIIADPKVEAKSKARHKEAERETPKQREMRREVQKEMQRDGESLQRDRERDGSKRKREAESELLTQGMKAKMLELVMRSSYYKRARNSSVARGD